MKRFSLFRPVAPGARETTPGGRCPACGSPRVQRRGAKGAAARLLRATTPWRPFRCEACPWQGWRRPEASEGRTVPLPPLPPVNRTRRRTGLMRRPPLRAAAGRRLLVLLLGLSAGAVLRECQTEEVSPAG